jgi:gamma-glutamyltranspeptidase/glutathione hydrolase
MKSRIRLALFLFCSLLSISSGFSQYTKVSTGEKIMIAAHPLAAKAGLEIFKKGGNVVDVAIATAYCLGVVEPHGSGIGGEGMMLIYSAKEKKYTIIDFKGISPSMASYENMDFKNVSNWSRTARGASVPGAVAGLELAREKFGTLSRNVLMQPSIDYAMNGFEVDSTLSLNLEAHRKDVERDEYSRAIYFPKGMIVAAGVRIKNPDYGKTLRKIQAGGTEAFYRGEIADLIAKDAEKNGGLISKEDLRAYAPIIRQPLVGNYRGYEIITSPPPCGGMHLIEALNILKYFNLAECRIHDQYSLHLLSETFKRVFKDEAAFNGDPEFSVIKADEITSESFAFKRFLAIEPSRAAHPSQILPGVAEEKNTTHLSVMDSEGNAVSLTITLSSLFGTTHTVEGTGFILNNEMQNFNPDEHHPNGLKPHKRVVTSLVPTIIARNGKPIYILGTPGGDLIISTITQVIVNLIDYAMALNDAVVAPRIFSTFYQRDVEVENRFPETNLRLLESLGHDVQRQPAFKSYFGAVQAVMYDSLSKRLIGVSDPRRSGAAVGE